MKHMYIYMCAHTCVYKREHLFPSTVKQSIHQAS